MPDIFLLIARRWSLIVLLTLAGTAAALIASLLSPKLYMSETTALPANTALNDKSRLFNPNIESLYSEWGSPDDLDKIEGMAKLDTVFLALASANNLAAHYNLDTTAKDALDNAALQLKKSSDVRKSGYGELNIKVWDKDSEMAAKLANGLLEILDAIYQGVQNTNNKKVLQQLKADAETKQNEIVATEEMRLKYFSGGIDSSVEADNLRKEFHPVSQNKLSELQVLQNTLIEEQKLIVQYDLAVKTTPEALLVVEHARPSPWYDRPKTSRNVLLAFLASLLFSFLLAVFIDSRNTKA